MNKIHLFLLLTILAMCLLLYLSIVPCKQTEKFNNYDQLPKKIADMIEKVTEDTKQYSVQNAVDSIQINNAIEKIKQAKNQLKNLLDNTFGQSKPILSNTNSIETNM